ncbi:MAG: hypothetical protein V3T70_02785 [Phycisphaerae bacterium]
MSDSAADLGAASANPQDGGGSTLAAQLRVTAGLLVAAALFWTVGWIALQPIDPVGPLSLLGIEHRLRVVGSLSLLSAVASVLAILVAGGDARLIGPLGSAVGLAALNLRGAQSDLIGGYLTRTTASSADWPAIALSIELVVWLMIVSVGVAAGHWAAAIVSAERRRPGGANERAEGPAKGMLSAGLSALIAFALILFLSGGSRDEVLKGQIYFAVGIGFLVSSMTAQFAFRSRHVAWTLAAVAFVGVAAYLTGSPGEGGAAGGFGAMRSLPQLAARPLPVEYASMGVFGSLTGIWLIRPLAGGTSSATGSAA